jgi:hypothetical protein
VVPPNHVIAGSAARTHAHAPGRGSSGTTNQNFSPRSRGS